MSGLITEAVGKRDGVKCFLCGSKHKLTLHHKKPLGIGGKHSVDNCVLLCKSCHYKEHGMWGKKDRGYRLSSLRDMDKLREEIYEEQNPKEVAK
jgi:5-methylcytosine-specific restriction endonuclease McrA